MTSFADGRKLGTWRIKLFEILSTKLKKYVFFNLFDIGHANVSLYNL